MTLLIAWTGADNRKGGKEIASLYLASDSRISWGRTHANDYSEKIFGSNKYPDLFGFYGDVMFPKQILSFIINQIDSDLLFDSSDNSTKKNTKVFEEIKKSLSRYPNVEKRDFTILHASRYQKEFKLFQIKHKVNQGVILKEIILSKKSDLVYSGGSGAKTFNNNFMLWKNEQHKDNGTSRAVYHCLRETLSTIKDYTVGEYLQLMGLYRIGNARVFGIAYNDKRYIRGQEVNYNIQYDNIEWRNERFERINPRDLQLLEDAQNQPL